MDWADRRGSKICVLIFVLIRVIRVPFFFFVFLRLCDYHIRAIKTDSDHHFHRRGTYGATGLALNLAATSLAGQALGRWQTEEARLAFAGGGWVAKQSSV